MENKYYISEFKLDNQIKYSIWYPGDDEDRLLTDSASVDPKILVFKNKETVQNFATSQSLTLENEEPVLHNFDTIINWLKDKSNDINCFDFLCSWNMFTDVAASLEAKFISNKKSPVRNRIYDKLFFGNNLPAITPKGKEFIPEWTKKEIDKISEIMAEGLMLLRKDLKEI